MGLSARQTQIDIPALVLDWLLSRDLVLNRYGLGHGEQSRAAASLRPTRSVSSPCNKASQPLDTAATRDLADPLRIGHDVWW